MAYKLRLLPDPCQLVRLVVLVHVDVAHLARLNLDGNLAEEAAPEQALQRFSE